MITINDILYAVITVMVPLLVRFLYQFVSVKLADSKYTKAVNAVYHSVDYVMQTFVDTLKKEGNFDKEAQVHAFEMAKEAALETMDAATRKWMEKAYTDLDAWLTVQIESAVKSSKAVV